MGNYKFRFSDMMPNVWFYKLKDMSRTSNRKKQNPVTCPASSETTKQTHKFHPRKSYYFTRELIDNGDGFYASTTKTKSIDPHNFRDPPRKSSKQQSRKENPRKSFPEFRADCILTTELSELKLKPKLPPIITKVKEENFSVVKEKKKISVRSPGVRLRLNSPRIRIQAAVYGRKSVSSSTSTSSSTFSGSFAVVKKSSDPHRDFKESMVEMITENNLRASKDLEDLLACYLTLNSDEYHDVIIKVFKQIWFDSSHVRMKQYEL